MAPPRPSDQAQPPRLGELLVEMGFIDQAQLKAALERQRQWGRRLGWVLVESGFITESRLVRALSRQLDLPICDPITAKVPARILALVTRPMALELHVIPMDVRREGDSDVLCVATADPFNRRAEEALRLSAGMPVRWLLAGDTEMDLALAKHYGTRTPGPASGLPIPARPPPPLPAAAEEPTVAPPPAPPLHPPAPPLHPPAPPLHPPAPPLHPPGVIDDLHLAEPAPPAPPAAVGLSALEHDGSAVVLPEARPEMIDAGPAPAVAGLSALERDGFAMVLPEARPEMVDAGPAPTAGGPDGPDPLAELAMAAVVLPDASVSLVDALAPVGGGGGAPAPASDPPVPAYAPPVAQGWSAEEVTLSGIDSSEVARLEDAPPRPARAVPPPPVDDALPPPPVHDAIAEDAATESLEFPIVEGSVQDAETPTVAAPPKPPTATEVAPAAPAIDPEIESRHAAARTLLRRFVSGDEIGQEALMWLARLGAGILLETDLGENERLQRALIRVGPGPTKTP